MDAAFGLGYVRGSVSKRSGRSKRRTHLGYVAPEEALERVQSASGEATLPDAGPIFEQADAGARREPAGGEAKAGGRRRPRRSRPPVQVELSEESGAPSLLQGPWPAVEVWTRNRIYVLDSVMRCIDVVDRPSGSSDRDNPLLGAILFGGQRRDGEGRIVEVSHPFPRPGSQAVFGRRVGRRFSLSETSPVSKVVLRVRVVRLEAEEPPNWEEISKRTML